MRNSQPKVPWDGPRQGRKPKGFHGIIKFIWRKGKGQRMFPLAMFRKSSDTALILEVASGARWPVYGRDFKLIPPAIG